MIDGERCCRVYVGFSNLAEPSSSVFASIFPQISGASFPCSRSWASSEVPVDWLSAEQFRYLKLMHINDERLASAYECLAQRAAKLTGADAVQRKRAWKKSLVVYYSRSGFTWVSGRAVRPSADRVGRRHSSTDHGESPYTQARPANQGGGQAIGWKRQARPCPLERAEGCNAREPEAR